MGTKKLKQKGKYNEGWKSKRTSDQRSKKRGKGHQCKVTVFECVFLAKHRKKAHVQTQPPECPYEK